MKLRQNIRGRLALSIALVAVVAFVAGAGTQPGSASRWAVHDLRLADARAADAELRDEVALRGQAVARTETAREQIGLDLLENDAPRARRGCVDHDVTLLRGRTTLTLCGQTAQPVPGRNEPPARTGQARRPADSRR